MSNKKKGLGRGFESLIPTELFDESFDPTQQEDLRMSQLANLRLTEIEPDPSQPRKHFDKESMQELADSIREHGVLQPIVVVRHRDKYRVVAGERRFRACQMIGSRTIPAIIRKLSDQNRLELSLIENIQRRDLNVIEVATSYLKLRDQFNLSLTEIGKRVGGKSASAVSNTLRLLKLPKEAIELLSAGVITEGQARPLIGLEPDQVTQLLPQIIKHQYSARQIEALIKQTKKRPQDLNKKMAVLPKKVIDTVSEKMSRLLDAKTRIKPLVNGSGKIEISFKNQADLKRIEKIISSKSK